MNRITLRLDDKTSRLVRRRARANHRTINAQVTLDLITVMEMEAFQASTAKAPMNFPTPPPAIGEAAE